MTPLNKGRGAPARGEQLPLALGHAEARDREDLLVSEPMVAAADMIDRWPSWPSPVVILVGPEGSGKSHLAHVWQTASTAKSIAGLSEIQSVEAASSSSVLLEDADRTEWDQAALFHTINAVRSAGTSLLMTARSFPSTWGVTLPDLASRLKAATVVEIGTPDDALLQQVLFKLFADRQLAVDDRLIAYIIPRMERSLSAAQDLVNRLDMLALARGVRISRALASEILGQSHEDRD